MDASIQRRRFSRFVAIRFEDRAEGGTLGFFLNDYQIEALWTKADYYVQKFIADKWAALVAPDFSMWADDPIYQQIWNLARSRVLARKWQDAGIPVFPTLNWSTEASFEFAFEGILKAVRQYSVKPEPSVGMTVLRFWRG